MSSLLAAAAVVAGALALRAFGWGRSSLPPAVAVESAGSPSGRVRRRAEVIPRLALRAGIGRLVEAGRSRRLLAAAGLDDALEYKEFVALKAIGLFLGVCATPSAIGLGPGRSGLLLVPLLPTGGLMLPELWLRGRARRRAAEIRTELPEALELIRASVAAGLSLERSLQRVVEFVGGPLGDELALLSAQTSLGLPRPEALDRFGRRNPLPEVRLLVAALERAQRDGTALGDALAGQAADVRGAANRAIEESGARAAPQIQLVVSMLLVPSTLAIFGSGVLAALLSGHLRLI